MQTYVYRTDDKHVIHIDQNVFTLLNSVAQMNCEPITDFTSTITEYNVEDPDWHNRMADLIASLVAKDMIIRELQAKIEMLRENTR